MEWWVWLVVALVVLVVLAVVAVVVQRKRRAGGVLAVDPSAGKRGRRGGGS